MTSPLVPILCCGPTPALQRTLVFPDWGEDTDVVRAASVRLSVGGKATNAARAVSCAGARASVLSFAGGAAGEEIQRLLKEEEIPGRWVSTGSPTRICQTLVDAEGRRIRELVENAGPVSDAEWTELFSLVEEQISLHSGLLLCGSLPEGSDRDRYAALIEIAHGAGKPVGIDAKGAELEQALLRKPDWVKINRRELQGITGRDDVARGLGVLAEQGIPRALITDGPRPAHLLTEGRILGCRLPKIDPVNPIGGGDTVTGVTFQGWLRGLSPQAAACQGLVAGLAQTLTPNPAEFDPASAEQFSALIEVI